MASKRTLKPRGLAPKWPASWPAATWRGVPYGRPIKGPRDLDFLRARIGAFNFEVAVAIGLDTRLRLRSVHTVAVGQRARVDFPLHATFRPLVMANLSAVILAHNHPSGRAEPSEVDHHCTATAQNAGRLLGVDVLDHVIVTRDVIVSLAEYGYLPEPDEWQEESRRYS